jgi:hypothetical protein
MPAGLPSDLSTDGPSSGWPCAAAGLHCIAPSCAVRFLLCAAFSLVCVALGGPIPACRLQAVCSQVICRYATQLARQATNLRLNLVPAYLCHLRLPERRQLAGCLVSTVLEAGLDDTEVSGVWFGMWCVLGCMIVIEEVCRAQMRRELVASACRTVARAASFAVFSLSCVEHKSISAVLSLLCAALLLRSNACFAALDHVCLAASAAWLLYCCSASSCTRC